MKTNQNPNKRNGKAKPFTKFSGRVVRRISITTSKNIEDKESGRPKRLIDYPIEPGPGFSML